ncbi:hypothetical protein [Beijerinckia mobilis]|uniref:hypothetical protein n=1 Tax=Beijerinckia mobilis TaxID=231434 RepID=UPI000ABC2D58|nr:hypothetical protein [Beijerinckia mobilis]
MARYKMHDRFTARSPASFWRKTVLQLGLLGCFAAPAGAAAFMDQDIMAAQLGTGPERSLIEPVQYVWGGRNYCWYPGGWQGPGWYWCGYAWRHGYGWGGGHGWQGWEVPGGWVGGAHGPYYGPGEGYRRGYGGGWGREEWENDGRGPPPGRGWRGRPEGGREGGYGGGRGGEGSRREDYGRGGPGGGGRYGERGEDFDR